MKVLKKLAAAAALAAVLAVTVLAGCSAAGGVDLTGDPETVILNSINKYRTNIGLEAVENDPELKKLGESILSAFTTKEQKQFNSWSKGYELTEEEFKAATGGKTIKDHGYASVQRGEVVLVAGVNRYSIWETGQVKTTYRMYERFDALNWRPGGFYYGYGATYDCSKLGIATKEINGETFWAILAER